MKIIFMQAIETMYKGRHFRSRVEARWAVFFDAMNFKWEYEMEGFILSDNTKYLPDFFFPGLDIYAEVKGKKFTEEEIIKCQLLSQNGCHVFLLDGPPDEKSYESYSDGHQSSNGIFMPNGDKYYPVYWAYDFDPGYMDDTLECIIKSRSARFEFLEKS